MMMPISFPKGPNPKDILERKSVVLSQAIDSACKLKDLKQVLYTSGIKDCYKYPDAASLIRMAVSKLDYDSHWDPSQLLTDICKNLILFGDKHDKAITKHANDMLEELRGSSTQQKQTANGTAATTSDGIVETHEGAQAFVAATPTERVRQGVILPGYEVISEYASRIKNCIDLDSFAEKLLEKRVINMTQKKTAIDERSGLTTDQRMNKLLDIVKEFVKEEEKVVFDIILEIIKDVNTIQADKLHDDMMSKYEQYKKRK